MLKKPINVLYVNGGIMGLGGIESYMMNYFRHIDREIVHIDFAVHGFEKGAYDDEILAAGSELYRLPVKGKHPFTYSKKLREVLKSKKYDIIHSHADAMSAWILKIAKECGIPVRIAHSHNTNHLTTNRIKYAINEIARRNITKYATECFACSELAGKWLFGSNRFTVIRNAVDSERYSYSEETRRKKRKELNIAEDKYVIGHVGRFDYQKNHEFLIKTFALYSTKNKDALLVLVGDGWMRAQIEQWIAEAELKEQVILLGNRQDVNELYSMFDLFVLPSRFEGLPVVMIEAQANGVPMVIADTVTAESVLMDNVCMTQLDQNLWVDKLSRPGERKSEVSMQVIADSGYDIKTEAGKLQDFYLEVCK